MSRTVSLTKKIPGGKTLTIDITIDPVDNMIREIMITGDFFAYPPEALEELEHSLKNKTLEEARKIIESYRGRIELVGISIEDIRELIEKAFTRK